MLPSLFIEKELEHSNNVVLLHNDNVDVSLNVAMPVFSPPRRPRVPHTKIKVNDSEKIEMNVP